MVRLPAVCIHVLRVVIYWLISAIMQLGWLFRQILMWKCYRSANHQNLKKQLEREKAFALNVNVNESLLLFKMSIIQKIALQTVYLFFWVFESRQYYGKKMIIIKAIERTCSWCHKQIKSSYAKIKNSYCLKEVTWLWTSFCYISSLIPAATDWFVEIFFFIISMFSFVWWRIT